MQPEIKHIKTTPNRTDQQTKYSHRKRWTIPYANPQYKHCQIHNEVVDRSFMNLITKVKALYRGQNMLVFERDSRKDRTQNCTVMHSFITPTLYLDLDCEFLELKCYVLYDFDNCPFEAQIRQFLTSYPLSIAMKHTPKKDGVAAFFNAVHTYQKGKDFYHLP